MIWGITLSSSFSSRSTPFFSKQYTSVTSNSADKAFAVCLDWAYYTDGRARQLIDYIGSALESAPCVELWHIWQGGFYSFDERPVIHRAAVRFDEFVEDDLRELGETDLWNNKETNRLSFYCLTVTR